MNPSSRSSRHRPAGVMPSRVARRADPSPLAVHRFHGAREAIDAIAGYAASLPARGAAGRASACRPLRDQDHPDEAFCLMPPHAVRRPLVLIGGMGPLAGALAFQRACERFGDSRATILYQACSVPDRTAAILAEQAGRAPSPEADVATHLALAVKAAVALLPGTTERADCILACNSAHYFWEPLRTRLARTGELAARLTLISIVRCSVQALRASASRRALLLCAEGARRGRIFSDAAAGLGVRLAEPPPALDRLLTRVVYEGVKGLDDARTLELGTQFFEAVVRDFGECDGLLAGCTELPPLIELLRARSVPAVTAFLQRVAVVDPMEAALAAAGVEPRVQRSAAHP